MSRTRPLTGVCPFLLNLWRVAQVDLVPARSGHSSSTSPRRTKASARSTPTSDSVARSWRARTRPTSRSTSSASTRRSTDSASRPKLWWRLGGQLVTGADTQRTWADGAAARSGNISSICPTPTWASVRWTRRAGGPARRCWRERTRPT